MSFGANLMKSDQEMSGTKSEAYAIVAHVVAIVALHIESVGICDSENAPEVDRRLCREHKDLVLGDRRRETARFFSKRAKCGCLRELYKKLNAGPTQACCIQCCKMMERRKLLLCARCRHASTVDWSARRLTGPNTKKTAMSFAGVLRLIVLPVNFDFAPL